MSTRIDTTWKVVVFEHSCSVWVTVAWTVHHVTSYGPHRQMGEDTSRLFTSAQPQDARPVWEGSRYLDRLYTVAYLASGDLHEVCTLSFIHTEIVKNIRIGP